jgi:hypothetical protein
LPIQKVDDELIPAPNMGSLGTAYLFEVKGQDDQQNFIKLEFLNEWIKAFNAHVGFGQWALGGIQESSGLNRHLTEK